MPKNSTSTSSTRQTILVSQRWMGPAAYYSGMTEGEYIPGKRIEVSFFQEGNRYKVSLGHSEGDIWVGHYTCNSGAQAPVKAKLYTSSSGEMVLIGEWEERGSYTWIANITPDGDEE